VLYECYIGLGSNQAFQHSEPFEVLCLAIASIKKHPNIFFLQSSSCYISQPHGPKDQPAFHNAVIHIDTSLNPYMLLKALHHIEAEYGLDRQIKSHWGPRTLDLDILLYEQQSMNTEKLRIPHPYLAQREFVILPLYELNPKLVLPDGKKVKNLAEICPSNGIIKLEKPLI